MLDIPCWGPHSTLSSSQLLSLDLSNKKPYQLVGLPNTMEHASHIKNLNLPNTEVRGGTQSLL